MKMKKNKYLVSPDINNNALTKIISGVDQDDNQQDDRDEYQQEEITGSGNNSFPWIGSIRYTSVVRHTLIYPQDKNEWILRFLSDAIKCQLTYGLTVRILCRLQLNQKTRQVR